MKNEKITFERFFLANRWKKNKYSRSCTWVVFGVQVYWFSPESYCYKLCFFGIDLHAWFKREFI